MSIFVRCMTSLRKNIKYIAAAVILILISGTLYLGAIRLCDLEEKIRNQEYRIAELEIRLDDADKLAKKAMYYIKSLHTLAEIEAEIGEIY